MGHGLKRREPAAVTHGRVFALIWTAAGHTQGVGDLMSAVAIKRALLARRREALVIVNRGRHLAALSIGQRQGVGSVASTSHATALSRALQRYRPEVVVFNKLDNAPALISAALRGAPTVVAVDDRGSARNRVRHRLYPLYPPRGFRGPRGPSVLPLGRGRRGRRVPRRSCGRIVVAQGGADTRGFTPRIVRGLSSVPRAVRIDVILGPAFRHAAAFRQALREVPRPIVVHRNPRHLASLMQRADLAVTAGGLMLFELAQAGVPCVVVCGERFEVQTAQWMARRGAVRSLGFGGDLRPPQIGRAVHRLMRDWALRCRLSRNARRLVDGWGADRVARCVMQWADGAHGVGSE